MAKMIINGEVYSGSTNYASAITYTKEDGTKSTVQKELDYRPVNNNILINSNFANPVNQRGETTKTSNGYWIDRWLTIIPSGGNAVVNDKHITLNAIAGNSYIEMYQYVEFPEKYVGKTITLSAKVRATANKLVWLRAFWGEGLECNFITTGDWQIIQYTVTLPNINFDNLRILDITLTGNNGGTLESDASLDIEWTKVELGEVATPYVPRLYDEEFQMCKRYYQKIFSKNSTLYTLNANAMGFVKDFEIEMRAKPTCIGSGICVQTNASTNSGFDLSFVNTDTTHTVMYLQKTNHGINYASYVAIDGYILADAEL